MQDADAVTRQPHIAVMVPLWVSSCVMHLTVHLKGEVRFGAIEVQNIGADRVLTPEPELAL